VVGTSLFIYRSLVNALLRKEFGQMVMDCAFSIAEAKACWDPFERKQALLIGAGVIALLVVAYAIYRALPWWMIRQSLLAPPDPEDASEMILYLEGLCEQMELRRAPTFLIDPLNPTVDANAFGTRGRYYVALPSGLVILYSRDRAKFQASVLHELAHLKNMDVDKAYFTDALWYAFLLMVAAPFAISLVFEIARFGISEVGLLIQVAWRTAILWALVYSIRNSIIRVREFYADVRAGALAGMTEPLLRVLSGEPAPSGGWKPFGAVHPSPSQRQEVLLNPAPLFRMGFTEAFGTGLAIAVAVHNVAFWLTLLLPAQAELAAYPVALLFFAPLAVGVVGLGTWRGAFASVTLGSFRLQLGKIGLGLGLGLASGRILSLHAVTESLAENEQWLAVLTSDIAWGLLLIALLYALLWWVKIGALAWLGTVMSARGLRRVYMASFVICAVLLTWWLGALMLAAEMSRILVSEVPVATFVEGFVHVVGGWPFGFIALILLVAFPLIGWLVRKRPLAIADSQWVFLDAVAGETTALNTKIQ
jgi:Zn-dependent protease with chaperone function